MNTVSNGIKIFHLYWLLGEELDSSIGFLVRSIHCHIVDTRIPICGIATRWNRFIPIKINVFIWHVLLDCIPTRCNLDERGIDLDFVLYPVLRKDMEDVSHFFFKCLLILLFLRLSLPWIWFNGLMGVPTLDWSGYFGLGFRDCYLDLSVHVILLPG